MRRETKIAAVGLTLGLLLGASGGLLGGEALARRELGREVRGYLGPQFEAQATALNECYRGWSATVGESRACGCER